MKHEERHRRLAGPWSGAAERAGWLGEGGPWPLHVPCAWAEPSWISWSARRGRERPRRPDRAAPGCAPGPDEPATTWARLRETVRVARILSATARCAAAERLRYRGDLFGAGVFIAILLVIFDRLWTTVAGPEGMVGDLSVAQLVTYLLVAELIALGASHPQQSIGEDVRSGAFAIALLRPLSYAQWELARAAGASVVRLSIVGAAGTLVLFALHGGPALDPTGAAVALALLVPAALFLELAARVASGLLAFWIEDALPIWWLWSKSSFVFGGLFLPLELYPDWLRQIALALPFSAALHGPARTAIDWNPAFAAGVALRLVAWCAVLAAALVALESAGRRRVQANGG